MNFTTFAAACITLLCLIIYLKFLAKVIDDICAKQTFRYGSRSLWIAVVLLFSFAGMVAYLLFEQRKGRF